MPESKASKYLTALYFWFYITVGSTNQPLDAVDVWTDAVALEESRGVLRSGDINLLQLKLLQKPLQVQMVSWEV